MTDTLATLSDIAHDALIDIAIAAGGHVGSTGNSAALYDGRALRELIHARLIRIRADHVVIANMSTGDYDVIMGDI